MKNITILVDTREKDPTIQGVLLNSRIPFIKTKLNFGDYSFIYKDKSYETQCVVERKNSVNEIVGNFTKGRRRFENEFNRAKKYRCKVHLMIEGSESDINNRHYYSTMSPMDVKSFLQTWRYNFGFKIAFVPKEQATEYILGVFENYIKSLKL